MAATNKNRKRNLLIALVVLDLTALVMDSLRLAKAIEKGRA